MRRYVCSIQGDSSVYTFEEEGLGNRRDGDEGCGVREALGVVFGSENGYGVGRGAECFHAFIGLLTVVESRCHAV